MAHADLRLAQDRSPRIGLFRFMIKIGDVFMDNDSFGSVKVTDIFISPTSQERVYEVVAIEDGQTFLARGEDLQ